MNDSARFEANRKPAGVEFPDWSGKDDSTSRIDVDTAFALCEEYARWVPEQVQKWRAQNDEKCLVEVVL